MSPQALADFSFRAAARRSGDDAPRLECGEPAISQSAVATSIELIAAEQGLLDGDREDDAASGFAQMFTIWGVLKMVAPRGGSAISLFATMWRTF